ncbi:hypothetical protein DSO57_1004394 [Entomophthora muscae]|uniref:Uncharacterized protein n=1 Tax=Entomophthora muscae TaxID=34485 RepID=A0ACC2SX49_9FUNG|nr:hypothetical protein DSO57_1004394 [Entomophthora muscae]
MQSIYFFSLFLVAANAAFPPIPTSIPASASNASEATASLSSNATDVTNATLTPSITFNLTQSSPINNASIASHNETLASTTEAAKKIEKPSQLETSSLKKGGKPSLASTTGLKRAAKFIQ